MSRQLDKHTDDGWSGKYFAMMLHMADDDLDPFEYRLLGHYLRVCGAAKGGTCYQTVRTISEVTRMSIPKLIEARKSLASKGWIRVEERANKSLSVTVVDRMAENIARYSHDQEIEQASGDDQYIDHGDQNIDRGDQYSAIKEKPTKNNPPSITQKAEAQPPGESLAIAPAESAAAPMHTVDDILHAYRDGLIEAKRLPPVDGRWLSNQRKEAQRILDAGYTPKQVRLVVPWLCGPKNPSGFYRNNPAAPRLARIAEDLPGAVKIACPETLPPIYLGEAHSPTREEKQGWLDELRARVDSGQVPRRRQQL